MANAKKIKPVFT